MGNALNVSSNPIYESNNTEIQCYINMIINGTIPFCNMKLLLHRNDEYFSSLPQNCPHTPSSHAAHDILRVHK